LFGAAVGAVGLLGWLTSTDALIRLLPDQPRMMPNTAIALLSLGIAGTLRPQGKRIEWLLSTMAACVAFVIGWGTLAEYAFGVQLGLDQLLIPVSGEPFFPGRPAPSTVIMIAFLAVGILIFDWRSQKRVHPSEWLILTAGLLAFLAMLGQLFGAGPLYRLPEAPAIGVAVPTALGCLSISAGLLLQRANTGLMRLISAPGPGSVLLLRLTPWTILTPVAIGLIGAHLLEKPGNMDVQLVFATLTATIIVLGLALLAITAGRLNRAHHLLEDQRIQTRSLIDLASDGFFVADLSARFTDVNDAGCRMLGFSRAELLGKTIVDLIRPEDVERLWADKAKFLAGEASVAEWMLRKKDGSYFPAEISAKILPDGRWTAITRDISQRKDAEEALRLSEAKFSGIVATSSNAIISIDEAQRIVLFNQGAEEMYGRTSAEMIGQPLDCLIPKRFRDRISRHIEAFLSGPDKALAIEEDMYGLRSNGEEFPAVAAVAKISVGGKTLLTVTLRNVAMQRRLSQIQKIFGDLGAALAATIEFEALLTEIVRLVVRDLAGLCIIDVIDDDQPRRARVMCRDASDGQIADALMRASDPPNQRFKESIRSTTEPVLFEHITPELLETVALDQEQLGAIRNFNSKSAIVAPLVTQGNVFGRLSLFSTPFQNYTDRDVRLVLAFAERAALSLENARLFRSAKRATRARDDMLGIVAHDLRNPLQAITLDAAVLRRSGLEPVHEIAGEIATAAQRMSRLIQDLVDVSSLEAGYLSIRPETVAPAELVAACVSAEAPIASSAAVLLRTEVEHDLPAVWADRDRLLQVFDNLVGNAIKFNNPGGVVTLGAEAGEGEVTFWVKDTGSGITNEHLPHVFDRFWRGGRQTRRGAGLGLAIVKGIVEAHGGRVWVQSAMGQGSTFYFTVPMAPSPVAASRAEQARRA
jgi:PAS domain S-box-containing protein